MASCASISLRPTPSSRATSRSLKPKQIRKATSVSTIQEAVVRAIASIVEGNECRQGALVDVVSKAPDRAPVPLPLPVDEATAERLAGVVVEAAAGASVCVPLKAELPAGGDQVGQCIFALVVAQPSGALLEHRIGEAFDVADVVQRQRSV